MLQTLEQHSISDTKENLSGLLQNVVKNGTPFVISKYGSPVAVVSPYEEFYKPAPRLMGALNKFANASLIEQEKQAWGKAVEDKCQRC